VLFKMYWKISAITVVNYGTHTLDLNLRNNSILSITNNPIR